MMIAIYLSFDLGECAFFCILSIIHRMPHNDLLFQIGFASLYSHSPLLSFFSSQFCLPFIFLLNQFTLLHCCLSHLPEKSWVVELVANMLQHNIHIYFSTLGLYFPHRLSYIEWVAISVIQCLIQTVSVLNMQWCLCWYGMPGWQIWILAQSQI